jgi:hypothetical protein
MYQVAAVPAVEAALNTRSRVMNMKDIIVSRTEVDAYVMMDCPLVSLRR